RLCYVHTTVGSEHYPLSLHDALPIFTQALTFIATCNALSYAGAHPVFVDVDRDTMGLSPEALRRWLSEHAEQRDGQAWNRSTGRDRKSTRLNSSHVKKSYSVFCLISK